MLSNTNGHILTAFENIRENISKGFYMSSIIAADENAKCKECGDTSSFSNEIFDKKLKLAIATCKCGGHPSSIRLRRSLPIGEEGKATRVDIRYTRDGVRLDDIEEAKHVARSIDYDIKSGRFDPNDYKPKKIKSQFLFGNYVKEKYEPAQKKRFEKGELAKGGWRKKTSLCKHLVKFFGEIDIRKISRGHIMEFRDSFEGSARSCDLVTQELSVIINFAYDRDVIQKKPAIPKMKKANIRDVEKFLTDLQQEKILNSIRNPKYKAMIECLIIYAMRPSEIRALQWRDLDFKNEIISINRHFSDGSHLHDGRKSNGSVHYLPMTDRFIEMMRELPRSIKNDDFIFKGQKGGAVNERALRDAWNDACKIAKVEPIELYEGTKHSRLSFLKRQGHSDDELLLLSGHTSVETLRRYAQITKLNKLENVKGMIQ